jgi:hypothetical protein
MQTTPLAPAFSYLCYGNASLACDNARSLDAWLLSSSGNRGYGDGNAGYSDCVACGHLCGDSVYGSDDHHYVDDEIYHHPIPGPSLHLPSD